MPEEADPIKDAEERQRTDASLRAERALDGQLQP